jgi:hypothetical protein
MARGDGKAIRGRTKQPKPEPRNKGVRRMAIGGIASDNGFRDSSSVRSTSNVSSSSSPASDNGFRDSSAVGSYSGGGGGNAGSTTSRSSMGTSIGAGGNAGSSGGVSSSRAGTSAANVAAAASPTGLANSASAAMHAAMAADRVNYGTTTSSAAANAATRAATQAASASSPTGVRGTLSSFNPQPAPVAGYGRTPVYNSALDAATVVPGSVSLSQVKSQVPFAKSPIGESLIQKSKQPLSLDQAKALQAQLPKGSVVTLNATSIDTSRYNSYPATVAGYNVTVGVPKSATGTVSRTVGQWSPSTASAASTSDFRGLPSPSQPSSGMAYSGAYQAAAASGPSTTQASDLRVGPIASFAPRAPVPAGTPGLYSPKEIVGKWSPEEVASSLPATDFNIGPTFNLTGRPSTAVTSSGTPYSDIIGSRMVDLRADDFRASPLNALGTVGASGKFVDRISTDSLAPTGRKQITERLPATESLGPAFNVAGRGSYTGYSSAPEASQVSGGPGFNQYGRGSQSYPSEPTSASPLQTSAAVAAALGAVDRFPNRDGGGQRITEAERLRQKRLAEQQAASDQITSGTTAMRSGGRANGVAQRGWTRGKFR